MASRILANHCLRGLATIHKVQAIVPCAAHGSKWIDVGSQLSSRLFIRSYAAAPDLEGAARNGSETVDLKEASKDRSKVIPVEVSMKYLKSDGNNFN